MFSDLSFEIDSLKFSEAIKMAVSSAYCCKLQESRAVDRSFL